jgi:hypothetical protein
MNQQQQNGISLFIKANNVNEELLRSLFGANVANAKILSIEIKTNYAFVHVDSKEAADNAISEVINHFETINSLLEPDYSKSFFFLVAAKW